MTEARHRVLVADSDIAFDVGDGERILGAARRSGVWLPYECGWGSCGTCKVTLLEGLVDDLFPEAPGKEARDERRRRIMTCQSTPRSDVVVKVRPAAVPRPERVTRDLTGRLVDVERLGRDIALFRFALSDDRVAVVAHHRPGQYAVVELAPGLRRCYSIANLPGADEVELVVKAGAGPGTRRLFELRPGERVGLELPYGDMWWRPTDRPALLVAGGTGVSAILALVRQLAAGGAVTDQAVDVVYAANSRAELVCWEELEALVARIPCARLHGALLAPDDDWTGAHGLATDALAPVLDDSIARTVEAYVAGPPPMVRAVGDQLRLAGVTLDRVHVDSFG